MTPSSSRPPAAGGVLIALGAIIGVLYAGVGIGTFIGPPFAGYVFDRFGSYQTAIVAAACPALFPTPHRL